MEPTFTTGHVRRKHGPVARRGHDQGASAQQRTARPTADGFLNTSFEPIALLPDEIVDQATITSAFFTSLENLALLYPISIDEQMAARAYPYNIALLLDSARMQLSLIDPHLSLIVVNDESRPATLATCKTFDTNFMVYYVPARYLSEAIDAGGSRPETINLFLSVYAYLNRVIRIPFFTEEGCWMYYQLEMMTDCYEERGMGGEQEQSDYYDYVANVNEAIEKGKIIESRIDAPENLERFALRVKHYKPRTKDERAFHKVARGLVALYRKNPKRSVWDKMQHIYEEPEEEGEYRLSYDSYMSFVWDEDDQLTQDALQSLNSEIQESQIDEPVAFQFFDTPQSAPEHDFRFEESLFPLIIKTIRSTYDLLDSSKPCAT